MAGKGKQLNIPLDRLVSELTVGDLVKILGSMPPIPSICVDFSGLAPGPITKIIDIDGFKFVAFPGAQIEIPSEDYLPKQLCLIAHSNTSIHIEMPRPARSITISLAHRRGSPFEVSFHDGQGNIYTHQVDYVPGVQQVSEIHDDLQYLRINIPAKCEYAIVIKVCYVPM